MSMMLTGKYFEGIWYTGIQSFSSVLMIMISLILFILGFFSYVNFIRYSDELKTSYQIEVYFDNNLDSLECRNTFNNIYSMPFIERGRFISKLDASKIFHKQFGQDIILVFGLNPLPCSGKYDVIDSFKNINSLDRVKEKILVMQGVEDINYPSEFIIKFDNLSSNLAAGFTICGLLFFLI